MSLTCRASVLPLPRTLITCQQQHVASPIALHSPSCYRQHRKKSGKSKKGHGKHRPGYAHGYRSQSIDVVAAAATARATELRLAAHAAQLQAAAAEQARLRREAQLQRAIAFFHQAPKHIASSTGERNYLLQKHRAYRWSRFGIDPGDGSTVRSRYGPENSLEKILRKREFMKGSSAALVGKVWYLGKSLGSENLELKDALHHFNWMWKCAWYQIEALMADVHDLNKGLEYKESTLPLAFTDVKNAHEVLIGMFKHTENYPDVSPAIVDTLQNIKPFGAPVIAILNSFNHHRSDFSHKISHHNTWMDPDIFLWEEKAHLDHFWKYRRQLKTLVLSLMSFDESAMFATHSSWTNDSSFWEDLSLCRTKLLMDHQLITDLLWDYQDEVQGRLSRWKAEFERTGDFDSVKPHLLFFPRKKDPERDLSAQDFKDFLHHIDQQINLFQKMRMHFARSLQKYSTASDHRVGLPELLQPNRPATISSLEGSSSRAESELPVLRIRYGGLRRPIAEEYRA